MNANLKHDKYYKNYNTCTHAFFYAEWDDRGHTPERRMSFMGPCLYSWTTLLGRIVTHPKTGERIYLSFDYDVSVTTSKQRRYALEACPLRIVRISCLRSFAYTSLPSHCEMSDLADALLCELDKQFAYDNFRQKVYRDKFISRLGSIVELNKIFSLKIDKKLKPYVAIREMLQGDRSSINSAAEIVNKEREKAKAKLVKEAKKAENKLKPYVAALKRIHKEHHIPYNMLYCILRHSVDLKPELLCERYNAASQGCHAFPRDMFSFNSNMMKSLRRILNWSHFIYIDPTDTTAVSTSRMSYAATTEQVRAALKLWKSGKLENGYMFDRYIVSLESDNTLRVGCHTFTKECLDELYTCVVDMSEEQYAMLLTKATERVQDAFVELLDLVVSKHKDNK